MPAGSDCPADCPERNIYVRRTVAVYTEHIDTSVNSAILYEDIATATDGGENATPEKAAAALIGCGSGGDGGSLNLWNQSNPIHKFGCVLQL